MKEIVRVLASVKTDKGERSAARIAFLKKRTEIWEDIRDARFPATYVSASGKKFIGAPRRTAIRCDFLLASKIALGAKYSKDRIADLAQRDLLFYVLRDREAFQGRKGRSFYCCRTCTSKLYECVSQSLFRYVDNAKWKAQIEAGGAT